MKILTISGFAQDPQLLNKSLNITADHLDYQQYHPDDLATYLTKKNRTYDNVIAWSLGTLIAVNYNHLFQAKKLILFAPIYQFLESANFQAGMAQKDFVFFSSLLQKNPTKWQRYFCNLVTNGGSKPLELSKKLQTYPLHNFKYLNEWLDFLGRTQMDIKNLNNLEVNLYHGANDKIISCKQAQYINELLSNSSLKIYNNSSHLFFQENSIF